MGEAEIGFRAAPATDVRRFGVEPRDVRVLATDLSCTAAESTALHLRRFGDPLLRYFVRAGQDPFDAEELRQDTFLRLYLAFERQEQIENIRAWLFKVAWHLMLDRVRRRRRAGPPLHHLSDEASDRVPDVEPTAEERLLDRARAAQVQAAITHLTPKQRACLSLRLRGYALKDIGDALDMDLRRVAEVLNRAVTRMKKTIEASGFASARYDSHEHS
jgi:RNA polymerase sigma-70 factor, ECF subfamily